MDSNSKYFSFFLFLRSPQRGQTLIEALAALAIISIVLSAIGVVVTTMLSNASFDKNETLATKYAQQGAEVVQQIRDDNYPYFQTLATPNNKYLCFGKGQTSLGPPPQTPQTSCPVNVDNTFVRTVQIRRNGCGPQVSLVTIIVKFNDGKCTNVSYCHAQQVQTCLSTVNPIQVP